MAGFYVTSVSVWSIPPCKAEREQVSGCHGAENCVYEMITHHQSYKVVGGLGEIFPGRFPVCWGGKDFRDLQRAWGLTPQTLTQNCTGRSSSLGKCDLCLLLC